MSIRRLFIASASLIGAAALASALFLVMFVNRTRNIRHQILDSLESSTIAYRIETALISHQRDNYFYKMTGDAKYLRRRAAARRNLESFLNELRRADPADNSHLLQSVAENVQAYFTEYEDLRSTRGTPYEVFSDLSDPAAEVRSEVRELLKFNERQIATLRGRLKSAENSATTVGFLLVLLMPLGSFLLLLLWRVYIVKPLRKVYHSISRYQLGTPLTPEGRSVLEIKEVNKAFHTLAARLEGEQQARFKFLAAVAHDIRNPLGAIRSAAEIMSEPAGISSGQQAMTLAIIQRQTASLTRLLDDLMLATSTAAGEVRVHCHLIDIRDIVEEVTTLYKQSEIKHRFHCRQASVPLTCMADSARLIQILHNLISNAIKYSPKGGNITVETGLTGNCVEISVSDEGMGMSASELNRIFEPFGRAGRENSGIKGLGLGLATAKKLAALMGGEIRAVSVEGQGSRFTLTFPYVNQPRPLPPDHFAPPA